jgi:NADPH:quinone reductase-like Zn-dependent oxidoreductase
MINQLSALITQGQLRPAPPTAFTLEHTVEAFDALVARRHTGRMLIRVSDQP